MKQLSLETLLEGIAYREFTCLDHDDYIAYLFVIPTDAFDYDFYDVNEFMINSGYFDQYIELGFEYLAEAYKNWIDKVVPLIKVEPSTRFVLVRYSPSRDKFVIVVDSANM